MPKGLHEGEIRKMMPDLGKPENWFDGSVHYDPNKGIVLTFLKSTQPFTPDFPTCPRDEVLAQIEPFKRMIQLGLLAAQNKFKPYFLEPKEMHPTLREIYRLFNLLAEHEVSERMKEIWFALRDLICLVGYEDTSYLWRFQFMVEQANIDKLRPTKDDRYWFKTRVDFKHGIA